MKNHPGLVFGYSSAADGTMSLNGGFANRQAYLATHGCPPNRTVHAGLNHGTRISEVTATDGGRVIEATDGLITAAANVALAMTSADCLLAYAYDPDHQVIALVHAGRRGLAGRMMTALVEAFQRFGTRPEHLLVTIGPSICPQHYAVQPADAVPFAAWPAAGRRVGEYVQLDLRLVARRQLEEAGVGQANIAFDPRCTFEEAELFSYRRDHPTTSQLQVGYLMRRS
ncbi:MAG: polyphenol oxidase family protein [Candidatus Kerfeldbacteria bacterium]|nr:polyphenol oxidase family protein [Candidatus Kerfeldbacteria bacterium]